MPYVPFRPPELHEPLGCENLHNICLLIVLVLLGVLNHKSGFHFPISKPTYMLQLQEFCLRSGLKLDPDPDRVQHPYETRWFLTKLISLTIIYLILLSDTDNFDQIRIICHQLHLLSNPNNLVSKKGKV